MGMADYCDDCRRYGICVCPVITTDPMLDARDTAIGIIDAAICQVITEQDASTSAPIVARLLKARDYVIGATELGC